MLSSRFILFQCSALTPSNLIYQSLKFYKRKRKKTNNNHSDFDPLNYIFLSQTTGGFIFSHRLFSRIDARPHLTSAFDYHTNYYYNSCLYYLYTPKNILPSTLHKKGHVFFSFLIRHICVLVFFYHFPPCFKKKKIHLEFLSGLYQTCVWPANTEIQFTAIDRAVLLHKPFSSFFSSMLFWRKSFKRIPRSTTAFDCRLLFSHWRLYRNSPLNRLD